MTSLTKMAALALALVAVAGCKDRGATGSCPDIDACGGDVVGVWKMASPTDKCDFVSPNKPSLNYQASSPNYFATERGNPAPAPTSGPWCWDLTFAQDMDGTIRVTAPAAMAPTILTDQVFAATVEFDADDASHMSGTYSYKLDAVTTSYFHLARSCFGVSAASLTCAEVGPKIGAGPLGVDPRYQNPDGTTTFDCTDASDGGCDCSFKYYETDANQNVVGDVGRWVKEGSLIHHYSMSGGGSFMETSPTRRSVRDDVFCESADTMHLTLSGAAGQPIALKSGLRTLYLTRVPAAPDAGAPADAAPDVGETLPPPDAVASSDDAATSNDADADAGVDAADQDADAI
ncbi:MAG TPA: hypothetical protein VHJ20_15225 [Polyangia bacterium]|nr:hypothetical protein [Polyangia bacterium]